MPVCQAMLLSQAMSVYQGMSEYQNVLLSQALSVNQGMSEYQNVLVPQAMSVNQEMLSQTVSKSGNASTLGDYSNSDGLAAEMNTLLYCTEENLENLRLFGVLVQIRVEHLTN
jgi:hypothetical protein